MMYQMMSVNPLDSICNPHVNLSEHKDPVVSSNVVSRPPKILRKSQRVTKPVFKLDL